MPKSEKKSALTGEIKMPLRREPRGIFIQWWSLRDLNSEKGGTARTQFVNKFQLLQDVAPLPEVQPSPAKIVPIQPIS
jgi:hypothetical protein